MNNKSSQKSQDPAPCDLLAKLNAEDAQYVARPCEVINFGAARLRVAVSNAIAAYNKSGRLMDAALTYAVFKFPIFPLDVRSKAPIPRRDPDPSGQFEDGIPGTGGVYKATTDPLQIIAWWRENPKALIGLPMGAASGVWCLDIDTAEDHANGIAEWEKIAAQHDPIVTREHRSATGGPHLLFVWTEAMPIRCSKGDLPSGTEVKGQGGYIVVPPSIRKGRSYTVHSNIDQIIAATWLTDRILQGRIVPVAPDIRAPKQSSGGGKNWATEYRDEVDLDELRDAMPFVPNDNLDWHEWTAHLMALFDACGDTAEGLALAIEFSSRSAKYEGNPRKYGSNYTRKRWNEIKGSPGNRTGVNKLLKIARENGWIPKLRELPPSADSIKPDAGDEVTPEVARAEIERAVVDFLNDVARPESELQNNWALQYYFEEPRLVIERAINASTGASKTQIVIAKVAACMHAVGIPKTKESPRAWPMIYSVPMHKLSERIDEQFTPHGINARIFYGRDHTDPEHVGRSMCLNPKAVAVAQKAQADTTDRCCFRSKEKKCQFHDPGPRQCGYYRQQQDAEAVQVWIVASDMLFYAQRAFDKVAAVIIDESFWQKGLRGIEKVECEVPLASLLGDKPIDFTQFDGDYNRDYYRARLGNALQQQEQNGPVEQRHLEILEIYYGRAIALEWQWHAELVKNLGLEPGMTEEQVELVCTEEKIDAIRHTRNIITIWEAVRACLNDPEITVCGRLVLKQKMGQRVVQWRGTAEISKQMTVPTLLLDATLPDRSILQVFHPEVEVAVDLKVAMPPSVHIRQVFGAPTSSNKLDKERHCEAVRRYILQRWLETGRGKTLIVCQLKFEMWLIERGLPENIHVEHYNNLRGEDKYRDVRLQILVGRTAPGPAAIEAMAGALTGQQPEPCKSNHGGFTWYTPTKRGIRLRDGRMIETISDKHQDMVAEPVRWQVHEAELIQAFGRARPFNRTADNPLYSDLLFNTPLLTVDEVEQWGRPSLLVETAIDEGVMLTAPCDLVRLWPSLWPNEMAAYRTVQDGVPNLPGYHEIGYQLRGAKMKPRTGYFDLGRIPDPYAWIAERLGPLKPL